jgi:hypothetical protein
VNHSSLVLCLSCPSFFVVQVNPIAIKFEPIRRADWLELRASTDSHWLSPRTTTATASAPTIPASRRPRLSTYRLRGDNNCASSTPRALITLSVPLNFRTVIPFNSTRIKNRGRLLESEPSNLLESGDVRISTEFLGDIPCTHVHPLPLQISYFTNADGIFFGSSSNPDRLATHPRGTSTMRRNLTGAAV